jgi:hypothetical protein
MTFIVPLQRFSFYALAFVYFNVSNSSLHISISFFVINLVNLLDCNPFHRDVIPHGG